MEVDDRWDSGDAYELFMGRWSRLAAVHFIKWLDVAPDLFWVDAGCGTGALTAVTQQLAAPKRIVGVEPSAEFVKTAQSRHGNGRTSFKVGDAATIPLADGQADVVVSGLALNFFPDLASALTEMQRVMKPGGTIAVYVWDYAGEMQFLRYFWDTAVALDPATAELDEGNRFRVCRPEPLRHLFENAGWQQVRVNALDIPTRFADFSDYWQPFLAGVGPAPAYLVSLDKTQQRKFEQRLRDTLPIAADGSISLIARTWVYSRDALVTVCYRASVSLMPL